MKLIVAGEGAFGVKHLEALAAIPEAEVVGLAGGVADATEATARKFGIPNWTLDLDEAIDLYAAAGATMARAIARGVCAATSSAGDVLPVWSER